MQNVSQNQYFQQNQAPVANTQPVINPQCYVQPQVQAPPVMNCAPTCQGQPNNVQVPNYSGVNIQIFNPSVATPGAQPPVYNVNSPQYSPQQPCAYPSNYYTQDMTKTAGNNSANNDNNGKKMEKRKVVELTDDYIRNVENYLNSQDKEIRMMGAKEVAARFQEDDSNSRDAALTALLNKMLQDPSDSVRFIALALLDSRKAEGNDLTVSLLQNMQNSKTAYGQDALQASNILLKMSANKVDKEFEVKDKPKTEEKNKEA